MLRSLGSKVSMRVWNTTMKLQDILCITTHRYSLLQRWKVVVVVVLLCMIKDICLLPLRITHTHASVLCRGSYVTYRKQCFLWPPCLQWRTLHDVHYPCLKRKDFMDIWALPLSQHKPNLLCNNISILKYLLAVDLK